MVWSAQAPANIALVKYMGKENSATNKPINPSLSYTLNHLLSYVSLEKTTGKEDRWEPLIVSGASPFSLTTEAQQRFLKHLSRIKDYFHFEGCFIVRSGNNFPHSTGLASSASSFAALTKCAVLALSELTAHRPLTTEEQAQLSRLGSGSSCRSFFSPWALWQDENVQAIDLPYQELLHQVIVISRDAKLISSSKAHQLVQSSPLYSTRIMRAEQRLNQLLKALHEKAWASVYSLCWQEFHDMHQLFTTCASPFSYITPQTEKALHDLQEFWQENGDGPIVTMDAGPNIHLLFRADQQALAHQLKQQYFLGQYDVL